MILCDCAISVSRYDTVMGIRVCDICSQPVILSHAQTQNAHNEETKAEAQGEPEAQEEQPVKSEDR